MTAQTQDIVLVNDAQVAAARLLNELYIARGEAADPRIDVIAAALSRPREDKIVGFPSVEPPASVDRAGVADAAGAPKGPDEDGIALWCSVLTSLKPTHESGDPQIRYAQAKLIGQYWRTGRFAEAITVQEGLLADFERALGPDHPSSWAARAALARLYRSAGQTTEAVDLDQAVLADRLKRFGPDRQETRAAKVALAESYRAARQLAKAIELGEEVLSECRTLSDAQHLEAQAASAALALSYMAAGETAKAINLASRCVICGRLLSSHTSSSAG